MYLFNNSFQIRDFKSDYF